MQFSTALHIFYSNIIKEMEKEKKKKKFNHKIITVGKIEYLISKITRKFPTAVKLK